MAFRDRTLDDCVCDMERASSLNEITGGLSNTLKAIGIDYYRYQIIRVAQASGRLPYSVSNYPAAWLAQYAGEGLLDDDPIVGEATRREMAFLWAEIASRDELSLRQRTLLGRAFEFGIMSGMSVPLSGHGVTCAVVSFAIHDGSTGANLRLCQNHHLLHLLAIFLHSRACQLLLKASGETASTSKRGTLTVREREVLGWVARGKSACEIALILLISKKSVEISVEAAKRKLQVFNRTHAVVKALELGLITASG